MEMKAKLPTFMDRAKRFGSIGWGINRDDPFSKPFHNKSVEWKESSTVNSSLVLNTPAEKEKFDPKAILGSNKIISRDRFHIRALEK